MTITYDRRAADKNAALAQDTYIRSQIAAEYQAKRNAANMRAAIITGLLVGAFVAALQLMGVL